MRLIFLLLLISCDAAQLPTPSDCIVKVNLDWKQPPTFELSKTKSELLSAFNKEHFNIMPKGTVGASWNSYDDNILYIQYTDFCDTKFETTESIFKSIATSNSNLKSYTVTNEIITPNINTILVTGPSWRNN